MSRLSAYYNEFDPKAAAWLRELIKEGLIADGEVDERSIADVDAGDLVGFTQCHFFAGIGGWSLALRQAGWPDNRPVWTGSCPCQPFSVAGKGKGTDDERHLSPEFCRLIGDGKPATVFGEQVASKAGRAWLAALRAEVEELGYGVGAADLCAAGVDAPHIRQRLWFRAERLADTGIAGSQGRDGEIVDESGRQEPTRYSRPCGSVDGLADTSTVGHDGRWAGETSNEPRSVERPERLRDAVGVGLPNGAGREPGQQGLQTARHGSAFEPAGGSVGLANTSSSRQQSEGRGAESEAWDETRMRLSGAECNGSRPRPNDVDWRDADWLFCRDGKWRPVEPGTQPLAHGVSGRVGLLRGYGNAIVPAVASEFIQASEEALYCAQNVEN